MRLVLPYVHGVKFRATSKSRWHSIDVRGYAKFEVPEIGGGEADDLVTPGDRQWLDRVHGNGDTEAAVRLGYRGRSFKPVQVSGTLASAQSYETALAVGDPSSRLVVQLGRDAWWTPAAPGLAARAAAKRFPLAYPISGKVSELHGTSVVVDESDRHVSWTRAARDIQENVVVVNGLVHVACYDPVWKVREKGRLAILLDPSGEGQHRHFRLDRLDAAREFLGSVSSQIDSTPAPWAGASPSSVHLRRNDIVAVAEELLSAAADIRHAIARQAVEDAAAIRCYEVVGRLAQQPALNHHEAADLLEAVSDALPTLTSVANTIVETSTRRALTAGVARWRFERNYLDPDDRHALLGPDI